jgi:hypothetical protein
LSENLNTSHKLKLLDSGAGGESVYLSGKSGFGS